MRAGNQGHGNIDRTSIFEWIVHGLLNVNPEILVGPGEHKAIPLVRQTNLVKIGHHRVGIGILGHRSMVALVPTGMLILMALAASS